MNKKVPVWLLLLALLLALNGALLFGWMVQRSERGDPRLARVKHVVQGIAGFPGLVPRVLRQLVDDNDLDLNNEFPALDGFRRDGKLHAEVLADPGHLLMSVFDPARGQAVVRLLRIADQHVVHEWVPDLEDLKRRQTQLNPHGYGPEQFRRGSYLPIHPLPLADGSIVFKRSGPLFRLDACSKVSWALQGFFHHSLALDRQGMIWTASAREPSPYRFGGLVDFRDDTLVQLTPEGKVLQSLSVTDILVANGYRGLVFGAGSLEPDMIHLNSVVPALSDGRHWKADDLLVSLRHRSTVFLYRPSTAKVVWLKTGPWLNQHSASFVGDHQIAVFGNDVVTIPNQWRNQLVDRGNQIYMVDLDREEISLPFRQAMLRSDVRTSTDGVLQVLDNGDAFVEETNRGRLLRLSPTEARWEFAQPIGAGKLSIVGWSRYLSPTAAAPLLKALADTRCDRAGVPM